jgi:hypothetical protein
MVDGASQKFKSKGSRRRNHEMKKCGGQTKCFCQDAQSVHQTKCLIVLQSFNSISYGRLMDKKPSIRRPASPPKGPMPHLPPSYQLMFCDLLTYVFFPITLPHFLPFAHSTFFPSLERCFGLEPVCGLQFIPWRRWTTRLTFVFYPTNSSCYFQPYHLQNCSTAVSRPVLQHSANLFYSIIY